MLSNDGMNEQDFMAPRGSRIAVKLRNLTEVHHPETKEPFVRLDDRVLQDQYAKLLRGAIHTYNFISTLNDSLQYFLWDYYYFRRDENIIRFSPPTLMTDSLIVSEGKPPGKWVNTYKGVPLSPGKTYLCACVGTDVGPFRVERFQYSVALLPDRDIDNWWETWDGSANFGTVIKIKPEKERLLQTYNQTSIVYEVEMNNSLDDIPPIESFRNFISKPSGTNHFVAFSE